MSLPTPHLIPKIHLLLISPTAVTAFAEARKKYLDTLNVPKGVFDIHIHESSLSQLEEDSVAFDLIVSPANSYGILDGGFDDAISRAFSPRNDYHALTRHVQDRLHEEWKGFAPPGTCTLIDIPSDWTSPDREPASQNKNVWGTKRLALLPTMRVPSPVSWDREVVYECIWSLLNALYKHNRAAEISRDDKITSLCMSPLATGAGYVSEMRWAEQLCLAIRHFYEATDGREDSGEISGARLISWPAAQRNTEAVKATWKKEEKGKDGGILGWAFRG